MTRVLIVEDDPGILRTLADNLKFEKYDVVTAMDGETAYRLHQTEHPDLIVLDVMLPRASGLEFCRLPPSWLIRTSCICKQRRSARCFISGCFWLRCWRWSNSPRRLRLRLPWPAEVASCWHPSHDMTAGFLPHWELSWF